MNTLIDNPRVTKVLRAAGIATISGGLVLGSVTAAQAAPGADALNTVMFKPGAGSSLLSVIDDDAPGAQATLAPAAPQVPVDFVPAFDEATLPAAAKKARQIELQREKRARQRAQRSSGTMFTPTKNYKISAVFGQSGSMWSSGHHTGLDFAAPSGTPVFSGLAGKVIESGWGGAYGNHVQVRHDNGVVTLYAHLTDTKVSKGDRVLRGQVIGSVGSTGNSSGPHLHFEVIKNGTQRDPAAFL